ncbi:MAG: hypothetical protein HC812_07505 [Leptolyngbya sp. RL_3_1]|nr:hypothetical protein [Leptolyngbya sp. RL_3_1]
MTFAPLAQEFAPQLSWTVLFNFMKRPLVLLALSLGLLANALPMGTEIATASTPPTAEAAPLADGVYLYGESPQPDERGKTYLVMAVQAGQAVGAFYQLDSSFDCFHGQVTANRIDMTIVNSYDQAAYPYEVALATSGAIASASGAVSAMVPAGFYAIDTLSPTDQQILATCQTSFPF